MADSDSNNSSFEDITDSDDFQVSTSTVYMYHTCM